MGKGKRKRKPQGHPARIARLRAVEGGVRPVQANAIETRPEYIAHMAAWRAAGSPRPA